MELATWILELVELDGFIVGKASSALGGAITVHHPGEAKAHREKLASIGVVGEDEAIWEECRVYVDNLTLLDVALGD
jgi:hypothetical protein